MTDGLFVAMAPSMKRDLAALAAREHRTMSAVVRPMVEQRLARRRERQP